MVKINLPLWTTTLVASEFTHESGVYSFDCGSSAGIWHWIPISY